MIYFWGEYWSWTQIGWLAVGAICLIALIVGYLRKRRGITGEPDMAMVDYDTDCNFIVSWTGQWQEWEDAANDAWKGRWVNTELSVCEVTTDSRKKALRLFELLARQNETSLWLQTEDEKRILLMRKGPFTVAPLA